MRLRQLTGIALTAILATLVALSCVSARASAPEGATGETLSGAGSTLVAPLVNAWAGGYGVLFGVQVSYLPVGSSEGVAETGSGQAEFGTTEAPLSTAPSGSCAGCVQVPWALSALAVGFHVGGLHQLRLTGTVLADIYLGRIRNWDDSRIAALNPHVHLPDLAITPVYRDASGENFVFTQYLSQVDADWRHKVGTGTSVHGPVGMLGRGDTGAIALLQNINGAIAYVTPSYLIANALPAAAIANAAGHYEYPNLSNITAAASELKNVPRSGVLTAVDPPVTQRDAYPLSTFTYVVLSPAASLQDKAALRSWVLYALGLGQSYTASLDFGTMPSAVISWAQAAVRRYAPTP